MSDEADRSAHMQAGVSKERLSQSGPYAKAAAMNALGLEVSVCGDV